jgi:hypothetical protein
MTWDPTLPADDTKIRNLGTVIRPNWEAIEEGDISFRPQSINLLNRNSISPVTPVANTGSYIIFSKPDSLTGVPELFGINANSNVTQLTNGLPTIGLSGSTFIPGGLLLKWGTISTASTATTAFTYSSAFPTNTIAVFISGNGTSTRYNFSIVSESNTGFSVTTSIAGTYTYLALGY